MIVRILGEGQLEVPEGEMESLNALDNELQSAVAVDTPAQRWT